MVLHIMEWEIEQQNRIDFHDHRPKGRRSFSTSTPFTQIRDGKKYSVLPSFSTSTDDSGLGASLNTVLSFADVTPGSGDVTTLSPYPSRKLCVSPPSSPITGRRVTFSGGSLSRKNSSSRRSIDSLSDHSIDGEEDGDSSNIPRKYRCSPGRRLDFDLDIYSDCDNSNISKEEEQKRVPHSSTTECAPEYKLSSRFDEILASFSPIVPDRLIGRRIGIEKVDIIQDLDARNISCVSTVMESLSAKDLCSMCQVSRGWKAAVERDRSANQRRKKFLKHRRSMYDRGKENSVVKPSGLSARRVTDVADRGVMDVLQSRAATQPMAAGSSRLIPEHGKTIADQFQEAATNLKTDEKLQKCPRCRRPAKILPVQDRGKCQNKECLYDYCIKCLHPFHGSKDCPPIGKKQPKNETIGTKKSKRNLKRL